MTGPRPCPCGSNDPYDTCCGPFHRGERAAPTAASLMRARFSAYAVGDADYLRDTWDPSTLPADFDIAGGTVWLRLHIVDTEGGGPNDDTGVVEFVARYRHEGESGSMRERSEFSRDHDRWRYVRGTFVP